MFSILQTDQQQHCHKRIFPKSLLKKNELKDLKIKFSALSIFVISNILKLFNFSYDWLKGHFWHEYKKGKKWNIFSAFFTWIFDKI